MQLVQTRLTTVDNPFSVFTQYEDWYRYDRDHDYGTVELLARFTCVSDELSDTENEEEMKRVVYDIIEHDMEHMYMAEQRTIEVV